MWIVRFALERPYTFVIVALLVAIFGVASIVTTPTDILPDINIPIVSVIWTYSGTGLKGDHPSRRASQIQSYPPTGRLRLIRNRNKHSPIKILRCAPCAVEFRI